MLEKKALLYSGKVKSLYETDNPELLIAEFRNDTTAFDGTKHKLLARKGEVNNKINAFIMTKLQQAGIPTHFKQLLSSQQALLTRLQMIPLESVVRNIAAGSLCKRLGIEQGRVLDPPLYELFLKNDKLHDPMVNENHALTFGWATEQQLQEMQRLTMQINMVLKKLFSKADLLLVDSKYEFGISNNKVFLGDEISPDSCRIWDVNTHKILDKDRFRKNLGAVIESYIEIAERLGVTL